MKKKKTYIPLPEGCDTFRSSRLLGLTVTFGEIILIFLGIFIPVTICAALKEHNPFYCLLILLISVLLLMDYGICAALVLLFSHSFGKPRVGILNGRIHMTDRKRSIPIKDIRSMDLYLGYSGKFYSRPPRLTISLPYDDTFEITRPSPYPARIAPSGEIHRGLEAPYMVEWRYRPRRRRDLGDRNSLPMTFYPHKEPI